MNSILQQLYRGQISPQENIWPSHSTTFPFNHWQEHFTPLLRAQAPQLSPEFDALMDDLCLTYHRDTEEMFCQGFSLAVKLLAEALAY